MAGESTQTLRLLEATHQEYIPGWEDQVIEENVLLHTLQNKGNIIYNKSGTKIERRVLTANSSHIDGWKGLDTVDFEPENRWDTATFDWRGLKDHYLIAKWDMLMNQGPNKIFDLQKDELESRKSGMFEALNDQLYVVTDSASKKLDGIASYNTNSATYAGLVQTTDTWWNVSRVNGDSGDNTDFASGTDWAQQLGTCIQGATHGAKSEKPDIVITDEDTWNLIHYKKLTPLERYGNEDLAKAGFSSFTFMGIPIVTDKSATAGEMQVINGKYMELWHTTPQMFMADSESKNNPMAFYGIIYAMHQLVMHSLRHQGVVYNTD